MTVEERETLIEFPCDFNIKAMGETCDEFENTVIAIVNEHVALTENAISSRQSSGGKYTSITVTVHVTSQVQLDTIYRALSGHDLIKYVL